ncbi:MAG: hypothetical protein PF961_15460 [Planctomycetota bacterium]|jgi:regulation of enolase protein 1 (concanavalin A-like superfamily)|nr:hypothetical protein [Planctomycetota bacterium]
MPVRTLLILAVIVLPMRMWSSEVQWQAFREPSVGGQMDSIVVSPHDSKRWLVGGDMLGIGLSTDRGFSWRSVGGELPCFEVGNITFHPTQAHTVWAGTMAGPAVSHDGGEHWTIVRGGMPDMQSWAYTVPIEVVLVDPQDPWHVLAFSGSKRAWHETKTAPDWGSVWEARVPANASANDWQNLAWQRIGVVQNQGPGVRSAAWQANGNLLAASSQGGVHRSTDGGISWTTHNAGLPHPTAIMVVAHPTDAQIAWVSLSSESSGDGIGGVWKSTDAGLSWQDANTGLGRVANSNPSSRSRYHALNIVPTQPNVLYTSDVGWSGSAVYRSNNSGASWTKILSGSNKPEVPYSAGAGSKVLGVDPNNADTVLFANESWIAASFNAGATWQDMANDVHGGGFFTGRGYSGLVCKDIQANPFTEDTWLAMAMDGGSLLVTTNGGDTWRKGGNAPSFGGSYAGCWVDADTAMVLLGQSGNFNGVAITDDAGSTWRIVTGSGLPSSGSGTAMAAASGRVLAAIDGKLYRSTTSQNWSVSNALNKVSDVVVHPTDSQLVYAATETGVFRSSNAGDTWQAVGTASPTGSVGAQRIALHPSETDVLFVTSWRTDTDQRGLWRYNGSTWTRLMSSEFVCDIAFDPRQPNRLVMVSNDHPFRDISQATGVHLSNDGGATWEAINEGIGVRRCSNVSFDPFRAGKIVVGTGGGGFFNTTLPGSHQNPTIAAIANQSTNEDTAKTISFTIGDAETAVNALVLSKASSNTNVLPTSNIIFGWSSANRTVTLSPAANKIGSATVTITVTDADGLTANRSFVLTVNAVNDQPTISSIANQSVVMNGNTGDLAVTIGDVETAAASLTLTRSSSNTTLVPLAQVVLGGSGANRSVRVSPATGKVGTATITLAVSDGSKSSKRTFVVTVTSGLPAGITAQDIGSPGATGSATGDGSSYTIQGAGADVWNKADAFQYMSESITGNVDVVVRVDTQGNTNAWAKAGIMLRESTAVGSRHVSVFVTPSNGIAFQYRDTTDGSSSHIAGRKLKAPAWLKLTRRGNVFTAYSSGNGTSWTKVAARTIDLATTSQAGLAVTSHKSGTLSTATFSQYLITPVAGN